MRTLFLLSAIVAALSVPAGADATFVLVSDDLAAGASAIYKLVDANRDGDALDAGEHVLWADGLASAGRMRRFGDGVLTVDPAAGQLVHLIDQNEDGDALDIGESIVWSDGFSSPIGLEASGDAVFVGDLDELFRLQDINGDGDAFDAGEQIRYAADLPGAQTVLARNNDLLVGTSAGLVHQLIDRNADGDALDAAEHLIYAVASSYGMLAIDPSTFLSSSFDGDELLLVEDRNGDGDALDVLEVLSYADAASGVAGPLALVASPGGGVLLVENRDAEVARIFDRNGDGDALDVGEVMRFGDGFVSPVGIVVIPEPPSIALTPLICWLLLVHARRSV